MTTPSPGGWRTSSALETLLEDDVPYLGSEDRYRGLTSVASFLAESNPTVLTCDIVRAQRAVILRQDDLDEGRGRQEPVAGLLGDYASAECPASRWRVAEERFEQSRTTLDLARVGCRMIPDRMRRSVAVIAAAETMAAWLSCMPFTRGNIWCAELHALTTLRQFEVTVPEVGPRATITAVQERYAGSLLDLVRGVVPPGAAGVWELGRLPQDFVEGLEGWPRIADLALALLELTQAPSER